MPKPNEGESRDEYMARCMIYGDLQKYDEKQRAAVCEHLYDREAAPSGETKSEQAPALEAERFEQFSIERPRIDRDKGEMLGIRVMGIRSAHGYEYTLDAQRAIAGRYEQMPVGIDHDYSGSPLTAADAWGVLSNPRVDDRGTIADLKYLKSHVRTEQILEDVERDIGLFSMSPVTTRCVESPKGKVTAFVPVRVDLVVRGATTRRLFEQQAAAAPTASAAELAALKAEIETLRETQKRHEQTLAVRADVQAAVEKTTAGIDLKKFWND